MKHIDSQLAEHSSLSAELTAIGKKINASKVPVAVAFVDLVGSTQMKRGAEPVSWLGFLYSFLAHTAQLAKDAGGTVVKRIGDELMITFDSVARSEAFVKFLRAGTSFSTDAYKVALDFGDAYHVRFQDGLPDDPYGFAIDRCARIAKLANAGTIVCSRDYWDQIEDLPDYVAMGSFALQGFDMAQEIYACSLAPPESESYHEPLLRSVNEDEHFVQGYKLIRRDMTSAWLREQGDKCARPFLARELLNVPRLPYSPAELAGRVEKAVHAEDEERKYIGYFVEWEAIFDTYTPERSGFCVYLFFSADYRERYRLSLELPLSLSEVVRELKKGQRFRVRGVITRFLLRFIHLNYVDLELLPQ